MEGGLGLVGKLEEVEMEDGDWAGEESCWASGDVGPEFGAACEEAAGLGLEGVASEFCEVLELVEEVGRMGDSGLTVGEGEDGLS